MKSLAHDSRTYISFSDPLMVSSHPPERERSRTYSTASHHGSRRYVGEYDTSLPSVQPRAADTVRKPLTKRQMVCRRGLTVLMCVLIVLTGLLLRLMFPPAVIASGIVSNITTNTDATPRAYW